MNDIPQESTNPLDQFSKEDLADMVSDAQRESLELCKDLETLLSAADMWLKFGPKDPHEEPNCGCDASVGFRDPSCHAYADFVKAVEIFNRIG